MISSSVKYVINQFQSPFSCGPNSEYPALENEAPVKGVKFRTNIPTLNDKPSCEDDYLHIISGMDGEATKEDEGASGDALTAEQGSKAEQEAEAKQEAEGEKTQEPEGATS